MAGGDSLYDLKAGVMVVVARSAADNAVEAIDLAQARVIQRSDWEDAAADAARPLAADLMLIEAGGIDDMVLDAALPVLDHHARARGARIVVALDTAQIDLVSTHLFGRHVQLLCAPSVADRVAALTIAGALRLDGHVSEAGHDAEASRLRRLNEEVARIAETLARLAREDGGVPERPTLAVGDRRTGYGVPPSVDTVGAHDIRQAIRARRMRAQFFDDALFEDPAWDMLLDLYAADMERAQVSVSSLCIAAAVAPTTALRWISKMTESGLLERHPDPFDRRRAFMALSDLARNGMRDYFAAIRRVGLSIA